MARLLDRLSMRGAVRLLAGGLVVLIGVVAWIVVDASQSDRTDQAQDRRITVAEADVAALSLSLARANDRLEDGGQAPVPVPEVETGPPGLPGLDGLDGSDGATGPAGRDGATGQDGRRGRTGAPGAAGADGSPGAAGAAGNDGQDGATGPVGPIGPQGPAGERGAPGAAGADGADGRDGRPPQTFTFTSLGITYVCADPDGDSAYTCDPAGA